MLLSANRGLRDKKMRKVNSILYRAYSVVEETKACKNSRVQALIEAWAE